MLGLKSQWDIQKAPARMDQRRYREQLRRVLYPCKKACEELKRNIEYGNELPPALPDKILSSGAEVDELALVLTDPDKHDLGLYTAYLTSVDVRWQAMEDSRRRIKFDAELREAAGKPTAPPQDGHIRKRNAAEAGLKDSLGTLIAYTDKLIGLTITLDRE